MSRISQYLEDTVDINDKLLGSDGGGSTKNFTLTEIAKFFKNNNSGGAVGQISYRFANGADANNLTKGDLHINTSTDPFSFSNVTTVKISKWQVSDTANDVASFITSEFLNKEVIIADTLIPNNYGVYNVTAIALDSNDTDFYDLTLTYVSGNGGMLRYQFYSIILFAGAQDLSFEFAQASAASTWTVNHNLGKFPSVTVKLSDGTVGQAAITHTNKNTLTISFSADTSGTAYMN